jgi:hypothetical protein
MVTACTGTAVSGTFLFWGGYYPSWISYIWIMEEHSCYGMVLPILEWSQWAQWGAFQFQSALPILEQSQQDSSRVPTPKQALPVLEQEGRKGHTFPEWAHKNDCARLVPKKTRPIVG